MAGPDKVRERYFINGRASLQIMNRCIDVGSGMAVHPEFGDQIQSAILLREARECIPGIYNGV